MSQFRQLMWSALLSGALAGILLFAVRQWTVQPLIEAAEVYERQARQSQPDMVHEDEGWQPASGLERNLLTAVTTILGGIGFAAVLFGAVALYGKTLTVGRGALWGLAGFACFVLAPALGLPPAPPGVAVAGLEARQFWWTATVVATATGLWLLIGRGRKWLLRIGGMVCLLLPHVVGAPVAPGRIFIPARLVHQFLIASVATNGLFWLLLGTISGFLYSRTAKTIEEPDGDSAYRATARQSRSQN